MTDLEIEPALCPGIAARTSTTPDAVNVPDTWPVERDAASPESHTGRRGVPGPLMRLLGLVGAVCMYLFAMLLMGGHPTVLLQLTAVLILGAIVAGGLVASHGAGAVGRLVAIACGASARDQAEAERLRAMCRRGRRLCHAGGAVAFLTGTMHVMSVLDHPSLIGPGIACAIVGVLLATLFAELGFGAAEHWVHVRR